MPPHSLDPSYVKALRKLTERLKDTGIRWAITGSLNHALQGLHLRPRDIDIKTDEQGVYAIERFFMDCVTQGVGFKESGSVRSHFGELTIEGVKVEIMGNVEIQTRDGRWESPAEHETHIRFIEVEGMDVPVFSLEHEHRFSLMLGREERAKLLEELLMRKSAEQS
ncbi:MAG: hypothetical protein JSV18_00200 [Candidatus Bathyarchaeota archaeon]|nr:MAG: hypothetical protein JSV18_00200 [Candidatus Bathyarchaeota archaeon]